MSNLKLAKCVIKEIVGKHNKIHAQKLKVINETAHSFEVQTSNDECFFCFGEIASTVNALSLNAYIKICQNAEGNPTPTFRIFE